MSFNYNKFVKEIYSEHKEFFTEAEVDELLNLHDKYSKDTPVSTGKRLIIHNVKIVGEKEQSTTQVYSGDKINFSLPFKSGVNMLIADNLKGKSSIFKIIKYALTGKNSLKNNIKKWVHYAFVNFYISDKQYTAYLDLTRRVISGCLLNGFIDSIEEFEKCSEEKIFEANSETSYQDQMNDFFFNQFTYYSLKWTQKSSKKDSNELLEVGASWKTYFKSILLESKDSTSLMYGNQGKKIFQMLLGIELTYPINRLSIKKDLLLSDQANEKFFTEREKKQAKGKIEKFQKRLSEIDIELDNIHTQSKKKINLAPLYQEHESVLATLNLESHKARELAVERQNKQQKHNEIKKLQEDIVDEIDRLDKELQKSIKQRNDYKEYIEIGVLFSNLDIKHCPSCNHEVKGEQKKIRLNEHKCSLCGDSVENDNHKIDTEVYKKKILDLEIVIEKLNKEIFELNTRKNDLAKAASTTYQEIVSAMQKEDGVQDLSILASKLIQLEGTINSANKDIDPDDKKKEKLISEKAVIIFQLNKLFDNTPAQSTNYEAKINLLKSSIEKLSKERHAIGARVLTRLSKLMKDEIQALGLNSITDVKIDNNFDIQYKQDNDYVSFDNIAEGEQLRAKIAFYLSLIQLDVEFNFGRHPRLLIIDSPSKEEADSKYLEGLSTVLKGIESRYGDNLQILVGTAERKLSGIIKEEKVIPADQYVF